MILALLVGIAIGIGATIVGIVVIEDLMEKRRD